MKTSPKWIRTTDGKWVQLGAPVKVAPPVAPRVSVNAVLRDALRHVSESDPTYGPLKRALAA